MANDWVKMRTDLYRDPKVCIVADKLADPDGPLATYVQVFEGREMVVTSNVTRNVTVGALVTLWGVTRHRGKRVGDDLLLKHATLSVVDEIVDLRGFGEAIATVGWAVQTAEGVVFPNFFETYNADPTEKEDATNAERQRRWRERQKAKKEADSNVTRNVTSNDREEKRREDITGTGANAPAEDGRDADRRPAPSRVNASEREIPGLSENDRKRWAELLIEPQAYPGMVDGNSTASLQSLERVEVVRWFQGALATSKPLTGPSALDLVLVLSCAAKAKTKGGIANRVAYFASRLIDGQWVNDTGAVVAESQWLAQQFRDGKIKTVRQREECAA